MLIIGHRGASGDHPEHTERAMRTAFTQGADGIECDIRLTRCGKLVCIHDPILDRVSNGRGRVSAHTRADLEGLDFGDGWPVLDFDTVLDIHEQHPGTHLFVETKHPVRYGTRLEKALIESLSRRGLVEDETIHVISFSRRSLDRVRRAAPGMDTIWLHRDWYAPLSGLAHRTGHHGYGANIDVLARMPKLTASLDGPLYAFTANTKEQILAAREAGVSYLATDYPAAARHHLRQA